MNKRNILENYDKTYKQKANRQNRTHNASLPPSKSWSRTSRTQVDETMRIKRKGKTLAAIWTRIMSFRYLKDEMTTKGLLKFVKRFCNPLRYVRSLSKAIVSSSQLSSSMQASSKRGWHILNYSHLLSFRRQHIRSTIMAITNTAPPAAAPIIIQGGPSTK